MGRAASIMIFVFVAACGAPETDSQPGTTSTTASEISGRAISEWIAMERDLRASTHQEIGRTAPSASWSSCLQSLQVPPRATEAKDAPWLFWVPVDEPESWIQVMGLDANPAGGPPAWQGVFAQHVPGVLRNLESNWPADLDQPGFLAMGATGSLPCLQHGFKEQTYRLGPQLYSDEPVWNCYQWMVVPPGSAPSDLDCLSGVESLAMATGTTAELRPVFVDQLTIDSEADPAHLRYPEIRTLQRVWLVPVGLVASMSVHRGSTGLLVLAIREDNQGLAQGFVITLEE